MLNSMSYNFKMSVKNLSSGGGHLGIWIDTKNEYFVKDYLMTIQV